MDIDLNPSQGVGEGIVGWFFGFIGGMVLMLLILEYPSSWMTTLGYPAIPIVSGLIAALVGASTYKYNRDRRD